MYRLLLSVITLIFLSGCGTIVSGKYQEIKVNSEPQRAEVLLDGKYQCLTPCTLTLERKEEYMIKVYKEGYREHNIKINQDANFWVFGNLVFGLIGAPIGAFVDYTTGSIYSLTPDNIYIIMPEYRINVEE